MIACVVPKSHRHFFFFLTCGWRLSSLESAAVNRMKPKQGKEGPNVRRFLSGELGKEAFPVLLGSVAMIGSALSNQALPRLMGRIIDLSSKPASERRLSDGGGAGITSSLTLVVLGGGLASLLRTTLLGQAESRIATRLRKQVFGSLMTSKNISWFQTEDKNSNESELGDTSETDQQLRTPGSLAEVLREDVEKVSTLTTTAANALRSVSSVVFSTYHMMSLNPGLFGVAVAVVPAVGLAAMILRRFVSRTTKRKRQLAAEIASFVEERLMQITLVHMSNRQSDEVNQYASFLDESYSLSYRASLQQGCFMGFLFIATSSALLLVVNTGGKAVGRGDMTSGQLTSFATYSFLLGLGTSGVFRALAEMSQSFVSAGRVLRLLPDQKELCGGHHPSSTERSQVSVDTSSINSIALQSVSFSYEDPSLHNRPTLSNFSMELCRGKIVGLVGKNGSGKSTAALLLAGLLQPTDGKIVLSDGSDWASVCRSTKRRLVQVVLQSTSLLNTSILENVRYSSPDASRADVIRALGLANCNGFVSDLPGGVDYEVGLNGCKLSGGQRQRIVIARALLADPAVLVLDEPTTGLDAEGEAVVADAIKACRGEGEKRALLLITHHAKTLRLTDEVLVLKDGALVEKSRFSDLQSNEKSELRKLMPDLSQ